MRGMNSGCHIARLTLAVLVTCSVCPVLADSGAVGGSAIDPRALGLADNRFAFDLLKQIASSGGAAGNIFISPYGVSSILQTVREGAAGDTRREMDDVLHLKGVPSVDAAAKTLGDSIRTESNGNVLNLANAIWHQQGMKLAPDFASRCADYFHAKTGALDFASPQSANVINGWASESTGGRIKDIVQWPFDPRTRVILANAIYFKGRWEFPFDKSATRDGPFTPPGSAPEQVPLMHLRRHFNYFETPDFQAIRLPYAGDRLQMYLFLPPAGASMERLLDHFDGAAWQKTILPKFRDREGTIALPRFKLDYAVTLNEPLQALGMKRAFSAGADFSGIAKQRLFISAVKQKSFVAVDEQGTEAAATTTVTMEAMAVMRPQKPFEMIVDHPFFFVIGDEQTRAILFMGIVANPRAD
jgi:serine protease inhibitor